jgi:hypothetical protein
MTTDTRTMAEIAHDALTAANNRCANHRAVIASDVASNRHAVDTAIEFLSFASSPARNAIDRLMDDRSPVDREPSEDRAHLVFADAEKPVRFDPAIGLAYLEDITITAAIERLRGELATLRRLSGRDIAALLSDRGAETRFVPAKYDGADL